MALCRRLPPLASVALLLLVAGRAEAFPLLRLFLDGDVESLGAGGTAFRDADREALRLERPALLGGTQAGRVAISLENEQILSIHTATWDGTKADDWQLRVVALAPAGELLPGVQLTLLAAVRREGGTTRVHSRSSGALLSMDEGRNVATLGLASTLPLGLSLGATLETGPPGPPGFVAEARWRPDPIVEVWALQRSTTWRYSVALPPHTERGVTSPDLLWAIDDVHAETELGGEVGDPERAWLRGGVELASPLDAWVEAGGKPVRAVTLRAGFDRELIRLGDDLSAKGAGVIARLELGLRRTRVFGGADVELGPRDTLLARYVHGELESASRADESGSAALAAFLGANLDLGLLLQTSQRLESHQLSLGWQRQVSEQLRFALGGQVLRLVSFPVAAELSADSLDLTLLSEQLPSAVIDLLGATASVRYDLGPFRLSAAVVQLLPLSIRTAPTAPAPTEGPGPAPAPRPAPREAPAEPGPAAAFASLARTIASGLESYGGGNLLLLQLETSF